MSAAQCMGEWQWSHTTWTHIWSRENSLSNLERMQTSVWRKNWLSLVIQSERKQSWREASCFITVIPNQNSLSLSLEKPERGKPRSFSGYAWTGRVAACLNFSLFLCWTVKFLTSHNRTTAWKAYCLICLCLLAAKTQTLCSNTFYPAPMKFLLSLTALTPLKTLRGFSSPLLNHTQTLNTQSNSCFRVCSKRKSSRAACFSSLRGLKTFWIRCCEKWTVFWSSAASLLRTLSCIRQNISETLPSKKVHYNRLRMRATYSVYAPTRCFVGLPASCLSTKKAAMICRQPSPIFTKEQSQSIYN